MITLSSQHRQNNLFGDGGWVERVVEEGIAFVEPLEQGRLGVGLGDEHGADLGRFVGCAEFGLETFVEDKSSCFGGCVVDETWCGDVGCETCYRDDHAVVTL